MRCAQEAWPTLTGSPDSQDAHRNRCGKDKQGLKTVGTPKVSGWVWLVFLGTLVICGDATSSSTCNLDALKPSLNGSWVEGSPVPCRWRGGGAAGQHWCSSANGTWRQLSVGTSHNSTVNPDWLPGFWDVGLPPVLLLGTRLVQEFADFLAVWISVFLSAAGCTYWAGKFWSKKQRKRRQGPQTRVRLKHSSCGKWVCQARFVGRARVPRCRGSRVRLRKRNLQNARLVTWAAGKQKQLRFCRKRFFFDRGQRIFVPKDGATGPEVDRMVPPLKHKTWFHGGAGAAAATKRKQQEKLLLEGLQTLLAKVGSVEDDSPRTKPPKKATGYRNEEQWHEEQWHVVGKNGKPREYPKGHGKGKAQDGPKKVHFETSTPNNEQTLLAALKALVLAAETQTGGNLLHQLQQLVSNFSGEHKPAKQQKPQTESFKTGTKVSKPALVPLRIDKTWWKGDFVLAKSLGDALQQGEEPPGNPPLRRAWSGFG